MIRRAFPLLLLVPQFAIAITRLQTPWKPDSSLIERLLRVDVAEVETSFPTIVAKSQRLPYAITLANLLLFQSRNEAKAEKYLNLALAELDKLEPQAEAADVYLLLMLLADRRNDAALVIKYGQTIYPVLEKSGAVPVGKRVIALNLMSRTYYKIGDFPAAVTWAQRSVSTAADDDADEVPGLQGEAYFALAEANYKLGDFHNAIKAADRARECYTKAANESGLGNAEKVLGNVKSARGNKTEAVQHYQAAIGHYERTRDEHGLGNCHFNLGTVFKEQEKWAEAIKSFEESIFHFTSAGSPGGAGMAKTQLGAALMEAGDLVKARVHLEEAKSLLVRDQALNRLAELDFILGRLYEKLNEVVAARSAYEESLQLYKGANDEGRMKPVQEAIERLGRRSDK